MTFFQILNVLGDLEGMSVIAFALRPEHTHASFHVLGALGAAIWDEHVLLHMAGLALKRCRRPLHFQLAFSGRSPCLAAGTWCPVTRTLRCVAVIRTG